MKIGITTFGCDLKSGMSRYVTNLITSFSKVNTDDTFEVLAHESALHEYLAEVNSTAVKPVNVSEKLKNPLLNVAWHQLALPSITRKQNYDALFLPAASRRAPLRAPCPTIGTVHDLAALHVEGKYDIARNFYQNKLLPIMIKQLTHIIAISESTKNDILEYSDIDEDKISVVHHAADTNTFYPREKKSAISSVAGYGIRHPYLIYISRIENPGKNHIRLIRAFEKLKKEEGIPHQLVLAGADWHGAIEVYSVARKSEFHDDILLPGFVNGDDLPNLYSGADLMVFPSLFEGFGLPILEAMACGVPVACSNTSSLPEIAGDSAVLFDPLDIDSIANGIKRLLLSESEMKKFKQMGIRRAGNFSWDKTAMETLRIIHDVAGR